MCFISFEYIGSEVDEKGYLAQSFQKVEPGKIVRFTLMPASRSCWATASVVFFLQSSSIDMISCSKSPIPSASSIAFAAAGSTF